MAKTKKIFIDGYNLIHKVPELRDMLEGNISLARDQLILKLADYANLQENPQQMTVVFDGRKTRDDPGKRSFRQEGIDIIFTDPGEEADDLIKRIVLADSDPAGWLVVTSDIWDISSRLKHAGIQTLRSEVFIDILEKKRSQAVAQRSGEQIEDKPVFKAGLPTGTVIEIHSGWVTIACPFVIGYIYLSVHGNFKIKPDSHPEGMQLSLTRGEITLINLENHLEPKDILFEFEGKLQILSAEIIDDSGAVKESVLKQFNQ